MAEASPNRFRFPGGKRKCLVMSYDDGSEHDRRLVDIFNRHGIRGTFHLNSGKVGQDHHIGPAEVASLYAGHEVSCHTVTHPYLTGLADEEIRREISDDRHHLEDLSGGPVRGLAYPFGDFDGRVAALLPELGIVYGRTILVTDSFGLPDDLLAMTTTCHHNRAMALAEQFLADDSEHIQLMLVWGHSYELDGFMSAEPDKDWGYMEAFCQRVGEAEDVYSATAIELADFLRDT